jgi:hypothetical protein
VDYRAITDWMVTAFGDRFFVGLLIASIFVFGKKLKKSHYIFIGGLLVFALIASAMINQNRAIFSQNGLASIQEENISANNVFSEFTSSKSPIAGFEQTVAVLAKWEDFRYGTVYLYKFIIQPIPRMFWHGKPTGVDILPLLKYYFGSGPKPLVGSENIGGSYEKNEWYGYVYGSVGETYAEFGWPGLFVINFLIGYSLKRIETKFSRSAKTPASITAYAGFYSMILLSGRVSIISVLSSWLWYFGVICLLVYLLEKYFCITKKVHDQTII